MMTTSLLQASLVSTPPRFPLCIANPRHHLSSPSPVFIIPNFDFHKFSSSKLNSCTYFTSSCRRNYRHLLVSSSDGINFTKSDENDLHSDSEKADFQVVINDASVSPVHEETVSDDGGDENGETRKKLPILVFLMGLFGTIKKGFEKVMLSEWLSWWPFWGREKLLDRLIAEADADPKNAEKQGALLAELNKQKNPEAVIQRFEQRDHAVDSKGVAEYLKALVATNAIAEYLPDELLGKASSLPSLLEELKQRASGNLDESYLSPGISEKQPLHVVMVDPKVSARSNRFAQELISTVIFTIVVGLVWLLGAAALQKYIGSLGGIGTSGVGSGSSYAPKDLNKEITPEKNVKTFKDVKGCDDAKQELEEVVEYLKNPSTFTRLGGKLPKV